MLQIINDQKDQVKKSPIAGHRGIGLGVFDGYHRGHQELIRMLVARSREMGIPSCVFTFSSHPAKLSGNPEKISMGLLASEEQKISLLRDAGLDEIHLQDFSAEFSQMPASVFLDRYLFEQFHAALIVVGYNYRFGRNREGDVPFLKAWAKDKNIEVMVIDPVVFCGDPISSTTIRKSIRNGDLETANAMLGREYSLIGTVKPGQRLGSKLGFPTANIQPAPGICLPKNGVYVTRMKAGNRTYESVTNIGLRPSVPGTVATPIIETMILDREIDLYGQETEVMFLHMLRKEKKFDQLEKLKLQVRQDIREAGTWHQESEQCWEMAKINRIPIYGIRSIRFTGNVIDIVFKMPLSARTASRNALLARILVATCKKLPSRPAVSKYLDALYGAGIESHVESMSDIQVVHFTADALHTWRGSSFPFQGAADLLFDMLRNPDLDDKGCFSKEIFESERTNLINEIKNKENDKTKYSLERCIDLLTEGTVQHVKSTGDTGLLEKTTLEDLSEAYREWMEESNISIFLAGNITSPMLDQIIERTAETFKNNRCTFGLVPGKTPQCYNPAPSGIRHCEVKQVEQARICIAYKGLMPYFSNGTGAVSVFNNMLGGDVHSLLFDVVREQMGLAYSVFSVSLRYFSSVVLVAGVSPENVPVAIDAMNRQLERLAKNDFDDVLYQSALESVSYSYRAVSDDLMSMVIYYSNAVTSGRNVSLQDALCFLKNFTRETIAEIAKNLEPSVTYVMAPTTIPLE